MAQLYDWSHRLWQAEQLHADPKWRAEQYRKEGLLDYQTDPKKRAEIYRKQGKLEYQTNPALRAEIYRQQGKYPKPVKPPSKVAILSYQNVDSERDRRYGRGNRSDWGGSVGPAGGRRSSGGHLF